MRKGDFDKVALQLYLNHTSTWVFSCKFAADFLNPFFKNIYEGLLLFAQCVISLGCKVSKTTR